MSVLRLIASELLGLFIDDGWLAGATLLWVAACAVLPRRLDLPGNATCLLLFCGLAAILLTSAWRAARR